MTYNLQLESDPGPARRAWAAAAQPEGVSRLMAPKVWLESFEEFKGSNTVLLSGSSRRMHDLIRRLRDFMASPTLLFARSVCAESSPAPGLEAIL